MQKDRKAYRLRYQYELLEILLDKRRSTIRKAMHRMGMSNETEDFVEYIKSLTI